VIELFADAQLWKLTVAIAAPFILAALGELLMERVGILNVAIEGMMAVGAAVGFLVTFSTGSLMVGILAAMLAAALLALTLAFYGVTLRAAQITVGLGLLVLGLGLASLLYRAVIGVRTTPPRIDTLAATPIPGLAQLPVLGDVLFSQNLLVYAAFLLAPLVHLVVFHTPLGLRLRACGENPRAADTLGVNVFALRYGAVGLGGLLIGLAGAYLPLAITGGYSDGMIGGRGWIALMLVIFARWSPLAVLWGAFLFAYVEALQFKVALLTKAIPTQFLLMLPYILALLVLIRIYRGAQAPAALTVPYDRESRG
jgi:general nucleoside transport system permease protein